MNTIDYEHKGKPVCIQLPGCWDELSAGQLVSIAKKWMPLLIALRNVHAATAIAFLNGARIELLVVLSGIRRWNSFSKKTRDFLRLLPSRRQLRKHRLNADFIEQYEHLSAMLRCSDFIFEKVTLTKNLLPVIKTKNYRLNGPADQLSSLCLKEFVFADGYFINFKKTLAIEDLNMLVAILYRPQLDIQPTDPGFSGDYRIPFNNMAVDAWLNDVQGIALERKVAIALFYEGCRNNLEKLYPTVFDKKEEAVSTADGGWFSLVSELPAEKFGTLVEREQVNIDIIFSELELMLRKMNKTATA
jgi:hypothetical protein